MRHYDDLELLEEVYLPGATETSAHVAACAGCRERLERLRAKLGSIRGAFDERVSRKPAAFWERQRAAVLERVKPRARHDAATMRSWALAASLVIVISGGLLLRDRFEQVAPPIPVQATTATVAPEAPAAVQLPTADPWASEELAGWEDAVDWESWLEPGELQQGGA
jgi:hypothetical protein